MWALRFELCVLSPEKFLRFSSHVLFSNAKILPNCCGLFLSQESNKSVAPKWRNKTSRLHNGHASFFFLTCCPLGMPLGRKREQRLLMHCSVLVSSGELHHMSVMPVPVFALDECIWDSNPPRCVSDRLEWLLGRGKKDGSLFEFGTCHHLKQHTD